MLYYYTVYKINNNLSIPQSKSVSDYNYYYINKLNATYVKHACTLVAVLDVQLYSLARKKKIGQWLTQQESEAIKLIIHQTQWKD